jgi:arylsulfatase A-like enzyme
MDKKDLTPGQIQAARIAYESCISYLDSQIWFLFEELRQRALLDNTVVIITSDHGELFGEHGLYGHGNCLYRPVLQVPLLIIYPPSVPAGFEVAEPVSLRDLPSTILNLVTPKGSSSIPGSSLTRYWSPSDDKPKEASAILSEISAPCRVPPDHGRSPVSSGKMQALLEGGKMYIKNLGNGREELYDFESDPNEQTNLVETMEGARLLPEMRRRLEEFSWNEGR